GELLIDMVSSNYAEDLSQADTYHRIPGGSPANMAGNLVRLGKKAALVASVGTDEAGRFLRSHVGKLGLDVSRVRNVPEPTTLILVTKSRTVSNFEAYRSADTAISLAQTDIDWICQAKVMHTTAFALSREPARTSILTAADQACYAGVQASIDANYATKIWPDRPEAISVIGQYLRHGALAKFSEVDYQRLFAEPVVDPVKAGERIRELGAKLVCLTMGEQGVYVVSNEGDFHLEARPVEVKDTTGAGDAFWAGFLSAWLEERSLIQCARAGRALAEMKLGFLGPLPDRVSLLEE
ncbi:MAG: carbohydrate kinase family protein, partial [Bacteroidota bacterium]